MQQSVKRIDLRQFQTLNIAIISDTHGAIDASVLDVVNSADVVLHAGDIMGAHVLDQLKPRLGKVIAVRGNNDLPTIWHDDPDQQLSRIPDVAMIECAGGAIAMEHGHLLFDIERNQAPLGYKYSEARMVVYGHTHVQKLDRTSHPWLLNPGAAGVVRNKGGASCYRLRIDGNDWDLEAFKFPTLRATA